MMTKNKTKIVLVLSIVVFLSSLGGLFLIINLLNSRNSSVADDRAELENEVALIRSMQQVRRSVFSSVDEQAELSRFFITEDSIPLFLGTLEAVAEQAEVSSSISRVGLGGDRDRLTVALKLNGSFESIHQYLQIIEHAPFRLSINRVFLQHAPEKVSPESSIVVSRWRADVELTLLSYTEESLPVINSGR